MEPYEPVVNYLIDPNSGLKQLLTDFLNLVMKYEAYEQSGVVPYERSDQRKAHRNGSRKRSLKTRFGELSLNKPQFREVPFERAVLDSIPKKDKQEIADKLRDASDDELKMQSLAGELRDRGYSPAAETIDRFRFDLWNYKAFPMAHWKRIRTTNSLEMINKELKRRSRPVGAFPSDKSLMRLMGCILININEEWITGKTYLSMDEE
ncbi:MAG TPA: transposase [Methanotrichaceae archaeon]|nr:transposase [Methanotrichaceae archaeon]